MKFVCLTIYLLIITKKNYQGKNLVRFLVQVWDKAQGYIKQFYYKT